MNPKAETWLVRFYWAVVMPFCIGMTLYAFWPQITQDLSSWSLCR
jgi:hypothetical protein